MVVERLSATTQTLLAELLDLEVGGAATSAAPLPATGSFVSKQVKGRDTSRPHPTTGSIPPPSDHRRRNPR